MQHHSQTARRSNIPVPVGGAAGCVRVHHIGWSALWDACVSPERIRPPSSQCARLMAEIDALKGLFLIPPTGHVRHTDDPTKEREKVAVGRVVDRAVRQATIDGPMQVMYYLEHIRGSTKRYEDDWYAADGLRASSRLATGSPLAIDTTQRLGGTEASLVRLRLVGEELWVCLSDWVRFATRGALTTLPAAPATVKNTLSPQKFGAGTVQAFPVRVLGSILRCLPLEHSRRHRQSGDAEWFRSEIASELSVINCASVLTPRTVQLPQRTETLRDVPGGKPKSIDVHVIQGAQPRVDASDFLRLVARQHKRHSADTIEALVHSMVMSGASYDSLTLCGKRVLPADLFALALDTLVSGEILSANAVAQFRSSSAWCWIREQLGDLTDDGAVCTDLAWQASADSPSVTRSAADLLDDDCGYEPVSWSVVESERGLERITQPVWSAEAESSLPKQKLRSKTDAKYVWAISEKDTYMKNGVNMDDIERVLSPTSGHKMEDYVGIGRITDANHPVLRYHSGTASAFLLYAMRDLPAFTVVGEYAGDVLTDVELSERQQMMKDNKTDNYSNVIYETANRSKKSKGATIWTSNRTNELILANDWREDVLDPRQTDSDAPKRRQNLNPVEVISTADGKPHILYVVGEEPVEKGAELLIDYGDDYWMCFRSEHKWSQKLQIVDNALAREQRLRRELERRVKELKAGDYTVDAEVQTEVQQQMVDTVVQTEKVVALHPTQQLTLPQPRPSARNAGVSHNCKRSLEVPATVKATLERMIQTLENTATKRALDVPAANRRRPKRKRRGSEQLENEVIDEMRDSLHVEQKVKYDLQLTNDFASHNDQIASSVHTATGARSNPDHRLQVSAIKAGSKPATTTLFGKTIFFAPSYKKQYASDHEYCHTAMRKKIELSGGKVVQFGRYDYKVVGDHDVDALASAASSDLTLAMLHSLLCETTNSTSAPNQIKYNPAKQELKRTECARKPGHSEKEDSPSSKCTAQEALALDDLVIDFKRAAAKQSSGFQCEGHDLIGSTVSHRHVDHIESSDGSPLQYVTPDSKQTVASVAKKIGCSARELCEVNNLRGVYGTLKPASRLKQNTLLLQPLVKTLWARVVARVEGGDMVILDASGVFTVKEDLLRQVLTTGRCLVESDISCAWNDAGDFFFGNRCIVANRRLSTDSSSSSGSSISRNSDGSEVGGISSPLSDSSVSASDISEVGAIRDTECYGTGVAVGMYIRRSFNVGNKSMPVKFTGRIMQRCGGQSTWCLICNTRSACDQQCGQVRVRYTDGDEEHFDLHSQKELKLLQSLVVEEAQIPPGDLLCTALKLA